MALVQRRNTLPVSPLWNVSGMSSLFSDMDKRFATAPMSGYPVDLYETDDALVLELAVPGIAVEDLDISLENRHLSISGKVAEGEGDRRYWLQSVPRGEFKRSFKLPIAVDVDAVEAKAVNGILSVTMPKVAEAKARKIEVSN